VHAAADEFFDMIIVGAGISGVSAAHFLQQLCPGRTYAILEARNAIGGTWDLFRYPGIRSDSDMFTLGYTFRPWRSESTFAAGPTIREYVTAVAQEEGIAGHIRFGHRVTAANWDSGVAQWTVAVQAPQGERRVRCGFLFFCSGYFDYERGHEPAFEGSEDFRGTVVHPQHWPESLDCTGRKVVVIGSGATAITLVPEIAQRAEHVTMLQRSPSYIVALPARDRIAAVLRRVLPESVSYRLVRWKNVLLASTFYNFCRARPAAARRLIAKGARHFLGPQFDVGRHLNPSYNPWEQRLCIAPDADVFRAVRSGKASIVTGAIERFTAGGLRLASGEEIQADIVVTATGLKVKVLGGAVLRVDGQRVDVSKATVYRGAMYSGVPNCAVTFGYTNASWTLKCELISRYVCRLLNRMHKRGEAYCVAVAQGDEAEPGPFLDLSSGYLQRAAGELPRQGRRAPWRVYQSFFRDFISLRLAPLDDGLLRFEKLRAPAISDTKPQTP
jgi:monooxygenase